MKPTREWDGRIGRVYWWIMRGRVHTHERYEWAEGNRIIATDALTHSHHRPKRHHVGWST